MAALRMRRPSCCSWMYKVFRFIVQYKRVEERNEAFQYSKETELRGQMERITQLTRKIANM